MISISIEIFSAMDSSSCDLRVGRKVSLQSSSKGGLESIDSKVDSKGEEFPQEEEAVEWEDEGEEDDEARVELGVEGKIWTQRNINVKAFMATMKAVWQPMQGLDISSIGKNMFVFQFYHWRDKHKVMEGQPWHFDNHAVLLDDIEGKSNLSNVELFELPVWARIYNLPLKGRLIITNMEAIGKKIGAFVRLDGSGSMGIDKSIRMRVKIDVRKPLTTKIKVKMRGGVEEWFDIKYERPPLVCYYCGKLGHGVKDCEDCLDEENPRLAYGGWIKASPWRKLSTQEGSMDDSTRRTCARNLFTVKPKRKEVREDSQRVNAVMGQLNGWRIEDINTGSGETIMGEEEPMQHDLVQSNGEPPGVVYNLCAGMLNTQPILHSNDSSGEIVGNGKKKVWRRLKAKQSELRVMKNGVTGASRKRSDDDGLAEEDADMQNGGVSKKRGVDYSLLYVEETMSVMNEVAGPTQWALGEQ